MTNPDTDTLKALLEKATPGPWRNDTVETNLKFTVCGPDVAHLAMVNCGPVTDERGMANADLIALAPDLAAETITLRDRVKELEEALATVEDRTREQCARVAEALADGWERGEIYAMRNVDYANGADMCAEAIRALKKETK